MDYWQKQTKDTPLYADILWSRPETRQGSGKLLIVGGNSHGFSDIGQAYQVAGQSGIGVAHCLLPNSLKRTVGAILDNTSYAAATKSGGFSQEALDELLAQASWADAVLLAGDFGRSSETAVLLEKFVSKYKGKLIITKDAIELFSNSSSLILDRSDTALIINLSQLQKLATSSKFTTPILLSMGLVLVVQALHDFSLLHPSVTIVTKELNNIIVAHNGDISSTKVSNIEDLWQIDVSTRASVFYLQNPTKPFQSITSSLI